MFKDFIQAMIFGDRKEYLKDLPYYEKEDCPFCNKEEQLMIKQTKHWIILYNKFPYYGHKQNLLAVPIKHKASTVELSDEELLDYKNVELFMKDFFGDKNYFSFIRQGKGKGGRSVEHLHYHYLEGVFVHSDKDDKQFNIINVS